MPCYEVPEGHLGLMLWLKENRDLECERHNRNKPPGLQKQPRRLINQLRKPVFLLEKTPAKAAPEQQIVISVLEEGVNLPDPWLC